MSNPTPAAALDDLPPWTEFRWRLHPIEPMPEARELLIFDEQGDCGRALFTSLRPEKRFYGSLGGCPRVVVRTGSTLYETSSGEPLTIDLAVPCWWSFIPPIYPTAEPEDAR